MGIPKVSVILPTYNRAALLGTAIESVVTQSLPDLELLVVDDGSTDETEALVRRYHDLDSRVRYLRQDRRGISAAMNAGIRAACGQSIARIDSDDQWLPDLLETEVTLLESHPQIGLVYSKAQWMTADLAPLPATLGHALHFPGDPLRSMLWGDATCNITVVVRRECFDRVGLYDESLATSEDWDMWLRMAFHYEFLFVDRVLAHVRGHEGSTTGPRSPSFAAFLGSRHKVLDKFFSRSGLPPRIAAMKSMAYRNLHVFEGNMWVGAGDWRRALQAFLNAVRAGGNPIATTARIAWFTLENRVLSRTAVGRDFVHWQSSRRLGRRQVTRRDPP